MLELTDDNFEAVIKGASQPLMVLFMSSFCGPSHIMFRLLDDSLDGESRFLYAEVDVEVCPRLTQASKVRGTPTLQFYARGELLGSRVGVMDDAYYNEFVEAMLAKLLVDVP